MESYPDRGLSTRREYVTYVGLAGAGAMAGCLGGDGGEDDTIQLGAPAALTGNFDYLHEGMTMVGEMLFDQINEAGGPLDRDLGWIQRDTGNDPQEARNVVEQLTSVDGCEVITGLYSSEIPPNWDYLQSAEVPVMTFLPGSRFLDTRGGDGGTPEDLSDDEWVWRTIISDSVHTAGGALNAVDRGFTSVGLLNTATEGERSWIRGFKDAANAIGELEITAETEVEAGASSYQSPLSEIHSQDFDALVVSMGLEDAIPLVRSHDQGGYETALILSDGLMTPDLIEQVGDQMPEETYLSIGGTSGPHADQLVSDFDDEYDTDNMGDHNHPWAKATYDAVAAVALAIHRAGEYDATAVQQNIRAVTDPEYRSGTDVSTFAEGKEALDDGGEINFNGAMSNVNFDAKGNVAADAAVVKATPDGWETQDAIAASRIQDLLTSDDYTTTTG